MTPFYLIFRTSGLVTGYAVLALFLSFWAQVSFSASQEKMPVIITSLRIDGLIGVPKDARYNLLLERISRETGRSIELRPVPGRRLSREFSKTGRGCLFPDYRADEDLKVIRSNAFNQAIVYLVVLKKNHTEPLRQINGLRVGVVNGYGYNLDNLKQAKEIVGVETERQNLNLLLFERVDAIISYFPDLPLVANPQEMSEILYDTAKPQFVSPERFACYDTPENRDFIMRFNSAIAKFAETGELATMLYPYYYGLPEIKVETHYGN
ncbi:transporter substrate-binding domain-containing protein [Emcibacter sp.]|uniref:substrate-binding periplasmic protein n=1 Tax=Emcibacter sp. TaxID=1979954 RepID=UPI002AA8C717|nr:transporter substrate-binding domain-containing protein [Emcibacter sp.]